MTPSKLLAGMLVLALVACSKKHDDEATKESAAPPATNGVPESPSAGPTRPAWITFDKAGSGECTDHAGELYCIGVSAPSADKVVAKQAATEVALDAMALHVAREAAADKADANKPTARKEIEAALGATADAPAAPVDWYWEKYAKDGGSGTEVLGFARFALQAADRKAIAAKLAAAK